MGAVPGRKSWQQQSRSKPNRLHSKHNRARIHNHKSFYRCWCYTPPELNMSKVSEILDILQEECAEVIQNVSKCRRFGLNNVYLDGMGTQRENLVKEIGDVVAMIDLLKEHGVVTDEELALAKQNKVNKLRKWSSIYDQD